MDQLAFTSGSRSQVRPHAGAAFALGEQSRPRSLVSSVARTVPCSIDRWHLGRVVMLAAETGARFERDALDYDPAAWMAAPRRLFGGASAIEACREEAPFLRGMLLHGLSVGLDADPANIDELLLEAGESTGRAGLAEPVADPFRPKPGLYTAVAVDTVGRRTREVVYAAVADNEDAFVDDVESRLGRRIACRAEISCGFAASHPVVRRNVTAELCEALEGLSRSHDGRDDLTLLVERQYSS